ncbi:hypothetical protein [Streptomyces sp. NPDC006459]|uniref:hypothetical protein n=1 Tax=Streptomyces sp. NPDC006459 TaxID=3154303 RepID=UPI0033AB1720
MLGTDSDRQALHTLLHAVVPGEWAAHWQTRGRQRFVRFQKDPSGPGAEAEFGPALWQAVRAQPGIGPWEFRRDWLTLAPGLTATDAVCLRLPAHVLGTERERQAGEHPGACEDRWHGSRNPEYTDRPVPSRSTPGA